MIRRWLFSHLIPSNLKFRRWIELEDKKERILRASDENRAEFPKLLISLLSDALNLHHIFFDNLYWVDILTLFSLVGKSMSLDRTLPIISIQPDEKPKTEMWDYEGRNWHYYSHLLSKSYGWSLEYIGNLDVFEALAKIQEILLNKQFDREFMWSMSEASVIYDSKSKITKANPLSRPYWMKKTDSEPIIPKIKIPKNLIPIGIVNNEGIPDDFIPKESKET